MINPADYTISIRRGSFDDEVCFEARVKEFPDVAEYADSYEEAYALAIDTVETTAEIFAEKGKAMPAPIEPADDFSGRVTLRVSKTLHRALVEQAVDEGVSLNQHMVNMLSYNAGYSKGEKDSLANGWIPVKLDDTVSHRRPTGNVRQVSLRAVA